MLSGHLWGHSCFQVFFPFNICTNLRLERSVDEMKFTGSPACEGTVCSQRGGAVWETRAPVSGSSQTGGAAETQSHSFHGSRPLGLPPLRLLVPPHAPLSGAFQIKCLLMRPIGVSNERTVNPIPCWLECFSISSGLSSAKT